ncbi:MAG: orotidine 5'-phosphate decarboxylase [Dehalococcoidales bacterium]|nr:orotidine 5'-phosphate decarboxylase [Dehalococcoidales bacterium]
MKLQLALDLLDLDAALSVARVTAAWIDIIEAGTPVIKSVGMEALRGLHAQFPGKPLLADMKTADVGELEVAMAAEARASEEMAEKHATLQ